MLFMGIDAGTQGVRCVVMDENGEVRAAHSEPFARLNAAKVQGWMEQDPNVWQSAMFTSIRACTQALREDGVPSDAIAAISIDGTSGTVLALDGANRPLTNGIMYNDPRAKQEAKIVHEAMTAHEAKLGFRFGASFSLPRLLWVANNCPEAAGAKRYVHQADYLCGALCGEYGVSDYSNALKTGYDLVDGIWPEEIARLGLDVDKLPRILRPGEAIARVTKSAAEALGLSEGCVVTGGSTDGYASALAAGAVRAGSWASIIGTTFVLKGVTEKLVIDPNGSSYSHKLPSGAWLLGGASNLGGKCLNEARGGRTFDEMNAASEALVPTGVRCYPLTGKGERFPFVDPEFEAFYHGDILGGRLYPAMMEGVGYAERHTFDHMAALGCEVGDTILTTGGACRSMLWLKIRASILGRTLKVPKEVDAAAGSALLAASATMGSLEAAAERMIRYRIEVEPVKEWQARYQEIYCRFEEELGRR